MTREELLLKLKNKDSFILAIDGKCGSGKSTLGKELQDIFGGNLFHMDDFYLPLEMRTKDRLSQPGGNVDFERFLETVLIPLSKGLDVHYKKFNCSKMDFDSEEIIPYHNVNIIEGSYSLRPELVDYYTDIIVLNINEELQLERLMKRNPENIDAFKEKWIPLENRYFEYYHIYEKYEVINNAF